MTTSDDEYDAQAGGPIELTEEDCSMIDALSASANVEPHATLSGKMPHIKVAVDTHEPSKGTTTPGKDQPHLWKEEKKPESPYARYRRRDHLSVTDLVAPTWCEVQFEYGLRQHRSRRIDKRPEIFVSREGKEIRVEKKTAQLNDVVLREGHAVHSALEREIHPTQVQVSVKTLEEHWGLRLLNMISDLQTLVLIGKCREFPVVGFIQGHLVFGVIDEITRTPIFEDLLSSDTHKKRPPDSSAPCTPSKHKSKRSKFGAEPASPVKQLKISSFFPVTPGRLARSRDNAVVINEDLTPSRNSPQSAEMAPSKFPGILHRKTHTLQLIDSKTRLSPSLPQPSATLSSRLQLMTYKRMLDALLSPSPLFDFDQLWKHIGVDSERRFSESFMAQVLLLIPPDEHEAKCLKDLEKSWWTAVCDLGASDREGDQNSESGAPVDEQLTLVYRLRAAGPSQRRKGKARAKSNPYSRLIKSSEEEDLEMALQESLRHSLGLAEEGGDAQDAQEAAIVENLLQASTSESQTSDVTLEMNEHASALEALKPEETLDPELEWAVRESLKVVATDLPQNEAPQRTMSIETDMKGCPPSDATARTHPDQSTEFSLIQSSDIIGRKQFKHDDSMLDTHLTHVLQWWHGEREPRGVELEESSRCHTCEYMTGCEWREKKALDVIEKARGTRIQSGV